VKFLVCDYEYDKNTRTIRVNCIGCVYGSSIEDYEMLHAEAKEKLIKLLNGQPGKGIDIEVTRKGKKIPIEVTVLPSWSGNSFPTEELRIKESRNKKPHQQFAFVNADLNVITVVTQSMLTERDHDGNYRIPKESLKFHTI